MASFLDKERIIAKPGFNRWLVPPAALAIHLSIGMAYGFSVFWLPLSRAVNTREPVPFPEGLSFFDTLVTTSYDWPVSMLGWMYTLFFVFLGGSAAMLGRWVENAGPRKAGALAAFCWSGGLALSAFGVYHHQIWLLWLGSGVLGGVGLGLGYISPVSALIKWFPDRRGLATGLAIMGFGGGAMVGAPFAQLLMSYFASSVSVGVWETFLVLAGIYFVAMMLGAFSYRLPPVGWTPSAADPTNRTPVPSSAPIVEQTFGYVPVARVHRTPQFWLAWGVLCLNVTAGIGILGMASPMIQEMFGGRLIGVDVPLGDLSPADSKSVAAVAAAFAGLLSLFNIVGRIAWSSFSDYAGRKATYSIFFLAGAALYAAVPWTGRGGHVAMFVTIWCIVLTMYGGGFAAIPAYLADLFGAQQISAIHGRLLTAWSVAGVLGPVAVNYLRDFQKQRGIPTAESYNTTMYLLAGVLLVGLICNLLIRPVERAFFENPPTPLTTEPTTNAGTPAVASSSRWLVVFAWSAVGIPILWGVWKSLGTAAAFLK